MRFSCVILDPQETVLEKKKNHKYACLPWMLCNFAMRMVSLPPWDRQSNLCDLVRQPLDQTVFEEFSCFMLAYCGFYLLSLYKFSDLKYSIDGLCIQTGIRHWQYSRTFINPAIRTILSKSMCHHENALRVGLKKNKQQKKKNTRKKVKNEALGCQSTLPFPNLSFWQVG